jgi:GntR family transcriptional regulator
VEALTLRSTALAAAGVQLSKRRTRDHRLLGPHDARDLARAQSSPALLSHRIRFTGTSIAIIDDHALPPVDSVVIAANRSPEGLEVHYTLAG